MIALRKTREKANRQVYSNSHLAEESSSDFKEKERGLGWRIEKRYMYKGGRNPPSFWGPSKILGCDYYSQLLVIPGAAEVDSGPTALAM